MNKQYQEFFESLGKKGKETLINIAHNEAIKIVEDSVERVVSIIGQEEPCTIPTSIFKQHRWAENFRECKIIGGKQLIFVGRYGLDSGGKSRDWTYYYDEKELRQFMWEDERKVINYIEKCIKDGTPIYYAKIR